ncbi:MAG: NADH-quinone oxidoreductase subunit C [Anaerolineales bacterium]
MNPSQDQIQLFEKLLSELQMLFPEHDLEGRSVPSDDFFVTIPADGLHPAVRLLLDEFDLYHLSTITGQAREENLELLYHFWDRRGVTLRILLPYDALAMPTLTDLIPGAAFYEREIQEMLGVTFEGHPGPQRLLMPDDWQGEHPLLPDLPDLPEHDEKGDDDEAVEKKKERKRQ